MVRYHFLALTDHRDHTSENSLYGMLSNLVTHPQCASIDVASRGNDRNDPFFYACATNSLHVKKVTEAFTYQSNGQQFLIGTRQKNIRDYQVILMRMPRPISDAFFSFLEQQGRHLVIINQPKGIQKTSTKDYLLNFAKLCPPMRLCFSTEEVLDFAKHFPIVLKPLRAYGGKGILKIEGNVLTDGESEFDALQYLADIRTVLQNDGYLAMKFLKNVRQGDKRILVVGGKVMAAQLRMPPEESWLCNVSQGGTSGPTEVTPIESKIIRSLDNKLRKEGIFIFGADTLVDDDGKRVLSEINTLSIGGFAQAERQTGKPVLRETLDRIMDYVNEKSK